MTDTPARFSLPVLSSKKLRPSQPKDQPKEKCGVIGIWNDPEAVRNTYLGLYAQQHRGQEAAGIAVCNGTDIEAIKDAGLVPEVFTERRLRKLEQLQLDENDHRPPSGVIG
ncbi:MAG: hypothetical protein KDA29_15720, partial [Phycisphaerales bacterium]|nr:hypothetical protein [Phycisphaerales bacterium]